MKAATSHALRAKRPDTAASQAAPLISLFATGAFVLLLGMLHLAKPGLDPSWHMISEYALGEHGWMMTAAFLALGTGAFGLAMALRTQVQTLLGRIGLVLLLLGAAGPILAAFFPMDPLGSPSGEATLSGTLHGVGAMLGDGILIGGTLLTLALLRAGATWAAFRRPLIAATVLAWAGFLAFTVSLAVLLPRNGGELGPEVVIGWQNRLMVIAFAVWLATAAWTALRLTRDRPAEGRL